MIRFKCQQCDRPFQVREDLAGRTTKCPKCGQSLTIPPLSPPLPEDMLPKRKARAGRSSPEQTHQSTGDEGAFRFDDISGKKPSPSSKALPNRRPAANEARGNGDESKRGGKKTLLTIAAIAATLLLVVFLICLFFWQRQSPNKPGNSLGADLNADFDYSRGPKGEKILKQFTSGGNNDSMAMYFHYYLDNKGNKVMHGPARVYINGINKRDSIYNQGTLVSSSTLDQKARLIESNQRLSGNQYKKVEFRYNQDGSKSQWNSVYAFAATNDGETWTPISQKTPDKLPTREDFIRIVQTKSLPGGNLPGGAWFENPFDFVDEVGDPISKSVVNPGDPGRTPRVENWIYNCKNGRLQVTVELTAMLRVTNMQAIN